jgi:hypothetical protein
MTLLNFAHPLTEAHLAAVERLTGGKVERVLDVKTQLDPQKPFIEQVRTVVESIGFSSHQWQTTRLMVNLPSLAAITALVLAELHGRCGYFPSVLRLKPVPNSNPPQFEVAEIINLQALREEARQKR